MDYIVIVGKTLVGKFKDKSIAYKALDTYLSESNEWEDWGIFESTLLDGPGGV